MIHWKLESIFYYCSLWPHDLNSLNSSNIEADLIMRAAATSFLERTKLYISKGIEQNKIDQKKEDNI